MSDKQEDKGYQFALGEMIVLHLPSGQQASGIIVDRAMIGRPAWGPVPFYRVYCHQERPPYRYVTEPYMAHETNPEQQQRGGNVPVGGDGTASTMVTDDQPVVRGWKAGKPYTLPVPEHRTFAYSAVFSHSAWAVLGVPTNPLDHGAAIVRGYTRTHEAASQAAKELNEGIPLTVRLFETPPEPQDEGTNA